MVHYGTSESVVSSYFSLVNVALKVTQLTFPTDKWPLGRLIQIYNFIVYWYLQREVSYHKIKKLSDHFSVINLLSEKLTDKRKDDGRQTI